MTQYKASDIPYPFSWADLRDFLRYLPATSATYKELERKNADWYSGVQTPDILADIYDVLAYMVNVISVKGSKKTPKVPKPYPRPWLKDKTKKYGKGAIPIEEFNEWYSKGK